MKVGYYPGCSLKGMEDAYSISLISSFKVLGIELVEIEDWNCCGASVIPSYDYKFANALAARNLALAEEQNLRTIIAPCSECYNRLAYINYKMKNDAGYMEKMNKILSEAGLEYRGTVEVKHAVDFLVNDFGIDKIKEKVKNPINKKIASYYGCLFVRPREISVESAENPKTMDSLVEALGGTPVDYDGKTKCCGASLVVSNEKVGLQTIKNVLDSIKETEAEIIVTSCPLCHANLDTQQLTIEKEFKVNYMLPVMYFTQLLGLALGLSEREVALNKNLTYEVLKV